MAELVNRPVDFHRAEHAVLCNIRVDASGSSRGQTPACSACRQIGPRFCIHHRAAMSPIILRTSPPLDAENQARAVLLLMLKGLLRGPAAYRGAWLPRCRCRMRASLVLREEKSLTEAQSGVW